MGGEESEGGEYKGMTDNHIILPMVFVIRIITSDKIFVALASVFACV